MFSSVKLDTKPS